MNVVELENKVLEMTGGRFTLSQCAVALLGLIFLFAIIRFTKKTFRCVAGAVLFAWVAVYMGYASPEQLKDTGARVKEIGIETFENMEKLSDSIHVSEGKVEIKLGDTWSDVEDIKSMVKNADGVYTVVTSSGVFATEDDSVIRLLEKLK